MHKETKERTIIGFLVIVLITLTLGLMIVVRSLQGNARVVNYAGIIRGATQRMVKLEIVGDTDKGDELSQYLDDIFSGLMHGGGKYQLTTLSDPNYNQKLEQLYEFWGSLKEEVKKVRLEGYEHTDLIVFTQDFPIKAAVKNFS